jgi:hypothetical protein
MALQNSYFGDGLNRVWPKRLVAAIKAIKATLTVPKMLR